MVLIGVSGLFQTTHSFPFGFTMKASWEEVEHQFLPPKAINEGSAQAAITINEEGKYKENGSRHAKNSKHLEGVLGATTNTDLASPRKSRC